MGILGVRLSHALVALPLSTLVAGGATGKVALCRVWATVKSALSRTLGTARRDLAPWCVTRERLLRRAGTYKERPTRGQKNLAHLSYELYLPRVPSKGRMTLDVTAEKKVKGRQQINKGPGREPP